MPQSSFFMEIILFMSQLTVILKLLKQYYWQYFLCLFVGGVNKAEMETALVFGVSLVTLIKNTFSSLSKCKPKTSEETLPVNATIFGLI